MAETEQANWRWYEDNAAEPTVALCAENTSATKADMANVRLRASLTGGWANYMVGWYPIDEMSGTSIRNIAQPLYCAPFPNLDLYFAVGNAATFWGQGPLYGNTGGMSANCYGMASAVSGGPTGLFADFDQHSGWNLPFPTAAFIYINRHTPSSFWSMGLSEMSCGNNWAWSWAQKGGTGHYANNVWNFSFYSSQSALAYGYRPDPEVVGHWVFLCYSHKDSDNRMHLGVVNDEGYLYDAYSTIPSSTYYKINRMRLFSSNGSVDYGYWWGSIGDFMIMHEDVALDFEISDWGYYYDMLRSRYNMEARKGW